MKAKKQIEAIEKYLFETNLDDSIGVEATTAEAVIILLEQYRKLRENTAIYSAFPYPYWGPLPYQNTYSSSDAGTALRLLRATR
jgi:hypothetical protein